MIDLEKAIELAVQFQQARYRSGLAVPQVAIDRKAISETAEAWILPWNDRRYLETGTHGVDGASPLAVLKETGEVMPLWKLIAATDGGASAEEDRLRAERVAALEERVALRRKFAAENAATTRGDSVARKDSK